MKSTAERRSAKVQTVANGAPAKTICVAAFVGSSSSQMEFHPARSEKDWLIDCAAPDSAPPNRSSVGKSLRKQFRARPRPDLGYRIVFMAIERRRLWPFARRESRAELLPGSAAGFVQAGGG